MKIFTISASELNNYQICPTLYDLAIQQRLVPKARNSSLDEGSWMHSLLETYYKSKVSGGGHSQSAEAAITHGKKLLADMDLLESDHELIKSMEMYFHHYRSDTWIPEFVEQAFSKILFENEEYQIILEGKIDLIVSVGNTRIVVDHKSSKTAPRQMIRRNNQILTYAFATGINNVVINKVAWETKDPDKKFQRQTISIDQSILDEWRRDITHDILELISFKEAGYYPKKNTQCRGFSNCTYLPICDGTPDTREWIKHSAFTVGEDYRAGYFKDDK